MKKHFRLLSRLICLYALLGVFSCNSVKHYKYFEEIPDSAQITKIYNSSYKEPTIQVDDILNIYIQTVDPNVGATINSLNNNNTITGSSSSSSAIIGGASNNGYLVDKEGKVQLPVLGPIELAGLTTSQARVVVQNKAKEYYKDPSVIVRLANFKITVIGEVQRPGSYAVPNEKVTVLDAIGFAGDLTIYGKRDNILLFRKDADNVTTNAIRLNLNSTSLLKSPYFYLKQNDVIYVEQTKTKVIASDASQTRNIAIYSATLSLLIVIISRFNF